MSEAKAIPSVLGVTCHAWNAEGNMVALSPNSNEVFIYETNGSEDPSTWVKKYTLTEHSEHVSSIDWCGATNQILTCSHDRNAYVWNFHEKEGWKPTLVLLRINRAATCARWSPSGKKFAIASGAKCVCICSYDQKNDWWISKVVKKHKSTVLSVAWSPNSKFIVTGSTDYKCRIVSAYIDKLDSSEDDGWGAVWPNQHRFGEVLAEFDQAGAWVHTVAWSPNGQRIAFAGHSSIITFVSLNPAAVQSIRCEQLPFLDIKFVTNNLIAAGGWDCAPILFSADASGTWSSAIEIDKKDEKKTEAKATSSGFAAARNMFAASVTKGVNISNEQKGSEETVLKTRHQNTITSVCNYKQGVISTGAIDGRLLFWDLAKLGVSVQ